VPVSPGSSLKGCFLFFSSLLLVFTPCTSYLERGEMCKFWAGMKRMSRVPRRGGEVGEVTGHGKASGMIRIEQTWGGIAR
jgi:hypothetical protein